MGKKNKKSSSSSSTTHDDPKTKKHKKSSTSTNIEASSSKSLKNEIKEIKKSIQELSETMNKIQEILLKKVDLLDFSFKEKEKETLGKEEEEEEDKTCCFQLKEFGEGNNYGTIFVKGFQRLQPKDEIRNALSNIFSSCGPVHRVFVPIECKTRVPLGFAFIDMGNGRKGIDKALELNGRYMGGRKLEVVMAKGRPEYNGFIHFEGCKDCIKHFARLHSFQWTEHFMSDSSSSTS